MWDVLRLIQPDASLESNVQRDMQRDVTCCTVTSASLLAILCLASGRSEDTRFPGKSMELHQLLRQRSEGRFTPLSLSAAPTSREKPRPIRSSYHRCTIRRELTMRAITIDAYKTQPHLQEMPRPQPSEGEILIRLHAAGVNPCLLYTSDAADE